MKKIYLLLALLFTIGACNVAMADDFYPATYRGGPLSVESHWDFTQPPVDYYLIPPDTFNAVGGAGGETLYDGFPTHLSTSTIDWQWIVDPTNQLDGGITPTSGNGDMIALELQNWIDHMPYKNIRLQITSWWLDGRIEQPNLLPFTVYADPINNWALLDYGYVPKGQGLDPAKDYSWFDIIISPNPDWETIGFSVPNGMVIDEIDIDTISIPEPMTIGLVGIGAVLAMRKRS